MGLSESKEHQQELTKTKSLRRTSTIDRKLFLDEAARSDEITRQKQEAERLKAKLLLPLAILVQHSARSYLEYCYLREEKKV